MIRKILFMLSIPVSIISSASCNARQSTPPPEANMPNPASVYCEEQGYKLEIITAADGSQNGFCVFPDGSTCDEWSYYRGECGPAEQTGLPSKLTEIPAATPEIDLQSTPSIQPPDNGTATVSAQAVIFEPLGYCFEYPQGFTVLINNHQVEVVGPHSGLGGVVAGLVWIDAIDAQGRTALEVANEEVNAFGGSPPRLTVMLGGEEALVLDGMPGQDPIRKVYIVHNGLLYTLNFSHNQGNDTANAQMDVLFESVISSWVWMSSGKSCPTTN